jgi:hypothetical protein
MKKKSTTFGATHCSLHLNGNDVKFLWLLSTEKHLLTCNAAVVTFLKENYMSIQNQKTIHCCTEYKHNKLLMQCHPLYQGEGPAWFDWESVYFEACTIKKNKFQRLSTIAKLLPFCQSSTIQFWVRQKLLSSVQDQKQRRILFYLKSGQ